MFCRKCGKIIEPEMFFCPGRGERQIWNPKEENNIIEVQRKRIYTYDELSVVEIEAKAFEGDAYAQAY